MAYWNSHTLEYQRDVSRFNVMATSIMYYMDDEAEDYYVFNGRKVARTHVYWMSPWLGARTDPNQRNTLAKLEADFCFLGVPEMFHKTTRMPPEVYKELLERVRPLITYKKTQFREPITAEERLSLTIRYLSRGDSKFSLAQGYLVGESTVPKIIMDTCKALLRVMHDDFLKPPKTEQAWIDIASEFHARWNMPHVLGALDGKHIRITRPQNTGSLYYNYKGYYSIILFAMVDAQYRFRYIDAGAEGKSSDSTLWRCSEFNKDVAHPDNPLGIPEPTPWPGYKGMLPYYFVGDDAFKMTVNLMKPYPARNLSLPHRILNYRISRCRRIVENAFGILSTRFRILRREIHMEPENVQVVVSACVLLHNYLRERASKAYMPKEATDWEDRDYSQHRGIWRGEEPLHGGQHNDARNHPTAAKVMRDNLADWCITKEGELPYQYSVVLRHEFYFDQ